MEKFSSEDLVAAAIAERPSDFEAAFASLIYDRVSHAVGLRKAEVGKEMFKEPEVSGEQE
jgi:hypothetical protein